MLRGTSTSLESRDTGSPGSADEADETTLLAGLRAGAPDAFETLVCTRAGRMLATARRFLRSEQDAADAVQEAFILAFQGIGKFEGNSKLGTWLHRIVINACLMKIRSESRRPAMSLESLLPSFDKTGHHAAPVGRWRNAPDEQALTDETRALVRRSIDMLPDDFRSVILLRDIEELSTEETAQVLETTPGAVKTRLHRARQALRTLLDPHFAK
jgi:RNA polymerase sigma-70 factor (ECF subfamily)